MDEPSALGEDGCALVDQQQPLVESSANASTSTVSAAPPRMVWAEPLLFPASLQQQQAEPPEIPPALVQQQQATNPSQLSTQQQQDRQVSEDWEVVSEEDVLIYMLACYRQRSQQRPLQRATFRETCKRIADEFEKLLAAPELLLLPLSKESFREMFMRRADEVAKMFVASNPSAPSSSANAISVQKQQPPQQQQQQFQEWEQVDRISEQEVINSWLAYFKYCQEKLTPQEETCREMCVRIVNEGGNLSTVLCHGLSKK